MDRSKQRQIKIKAVTDRIEQIKKNLLIGYEFLATGAHGNWHGFKPLYVEKTKDGIALPPHRDWVKNVFIAELERSLVKAEKKLETIEKQDN